MDNARKWANTFIVNQALVLCENFKGANYSRYFESELINLLLKIRHAVPHLNRKQLVKILKVAPLIGIQLRDSRIQTVNCLSQDILCIMRQLSCTKPDPITVVTK